MADTELTPDRLARIAELETHGLTRAEAELAESIEAGEVDGDVIRLGEPE